CSLATHHNSWAYRMGTFSALSFAVQMVFRTLFLTSPDPLGWIPIIYVCLIWYYLVRVRHDRGEVAATVLPYAIFSIPYGYTATAIGTGRPATAYGISINMFLLLAAAKGAALLSERWRDELQRVPARWRAPAIALVGVAVLCSFVIPYRTTYAYMEEFAFLS